jgi:Spy/CpxP family protein refolding chaperone
MLVLLLGSLLVTTVTHAQRPSPMDPEARLDRTMEDLTSRLSLTGEQAKQIRTVFDEQFDEQRKLFETLRSQGGGPGEEARIKMMELENKSAERIEALLSPEQVKSYRAYREEEQQRRPPFGPPRGGQ